LFSENRYCVSIAFVGSLPGEKSNARRLTSLKRLADSASTRKGSVSLPNFCEVLLRNQEELNLSLHSCELRIGSLYDALRCDSGILVIGSGNGHAIGVACAEKKITDATPRSHLNRLHIDEPSAVKVIAEELGIDHRDWVNYIYVSFNNIEA
jgi:hypothetical protein